MATLATVRGLARRGFRVNSTNRVNYAKSTTVNVDAFPDARFLSAHQGDFYTVPELDILLSFDGAFTDSDVRFIVVPREVSVSNVTGTLGTVSSANDVKVTISRIPASEGGTDGTPDATEELVIAEGETVGQASIDPALTFAPGDIISVAVTAEGTSAQNLKVSFILS